jgi:hypothetical protein
MRPCCPHAEPRRWRTYGYLATLSQDLTQAQGDESLRAACIQPLEMLKAQVRQEGSLAHITQAEGEAVKAIR